MFKRAFFFILSSLVLFGCIAPIFSSAASAPFTYNTSISMPTLASNQWGYVYATDDHTGIYVIFECDAIPYYTSGYGLNPDFSSGYPGVILNLSQSWSGNINLSLYDLDHGYLLTTETKAISSTTSINTTFFRSADIKFSNYISTPAYYYPLGSSKSNTDSANYPRVDPFVNWDYSGSSDPTPDPVDPSSVIRSLIPRPYGNACTFYIADHLYLYSIFVGVPQQFEENGYISSDDPNHFYSDNYNLFDLTFNSSGSSLQFTIKNRAEFSYNVIVTKYGVVDGSFVSSQAHAVTAATNATTPGTSTFSISLSDPVTYGIYQSGFFARSHSISYPELRISWSDTIDYSLDFFVIRQGLVTIVQNQTSIISAFGTANSTLSTISSTSSSILSQLQSFYSLCDTNFTWFKTTYFNTITQKWDITKTQLDTIISLLRGQQGQETLPYRDDVQSGVDSYVESESGFMNTFDSNGAEIDSIFNDINGRFNSLSSSFAVVSRMFQSFVLENTIVLPLVLFSLAFGLVMLIIGRKAS